MAIINRHPAGMSVLGELHLSSELGFTYPCRLSEYDQRGIAFLESRMEAGDAAAGLVKCFWRDVVAFVKAHGGRIVQQLRNPLEVTGYNMGTKPKVVKLFLHRESADPKDVFTAHCMWYATSYMEAIRREAREPIYLIEDLNASMGGDGQYLKGYIEYMTQTPLPDDYLAYIQEEMLPGFHYRLETVREGDRVVEIQTTQYPKERWRMNWDPDPRPAYYWSVWTDWERDLFREYLGPVMDKLGYEIPG